MSSKLKIVVIGAGVGGLALAQGLKKAGLQVAVFERDVEPESRQAGYRLSISPSGAAALRDCLPGDLYERFTRRAAVRFGASRLSIIISRRCSPSTRTPRPTAPPPPPSGRSRAAR